MKKLLILTAIALLNPFSASAQNCISTDAACFRQPGSLAPEAKIDAAGVPTFSGLANCDTIDTDANGVASCGTDGGGGGHVIKTSTDGVIGTELTTEPTRANLAFGPSFTLLDDAGKDANIVTFAGNLGNETWIVVEEKSFSASATETFSGLDSGSQYKVLIEYDHASTSGYPQVRFNTDSGSNYRYTSQSLRSINGTGTSSTSNSATFCKTYTDVSLIVAGETYKGEYSFSSVVDTEVQLTNLFTSQDNGGSTNGNGGCTYDGASSMSSITMLVSAGNMTGTAKLMKLAPMAVGSAISVPASSSTYTSATTLVLGGLANTWFAVPGGEVTLDTSGGTVDLYATGSIFDANGGEQILCANLLMDGAVVGGYDNNTTVPGGGHAWCSTDDAILATGFSITLSGIVATAGSHTFSIEAMSNADGPRASSIRLTAVERRNVAGTGDVASNGNNTFTGEQKGPQFISAWVKFNGSGSVAVTKGYNVTSVTDNGTGNYTINFTNAMDDANYGISCVTEDTTAGDSRTCMVTATATGSVTVHTVLSDGGTEFDPDFVYLSIIGGRQ